MKDDLESSARTGYTEAKRDRGRHRITYITRLCICRTDTKRNIKKISFTKIYKGEDIVESHNY